MKTIPQIVTLREPIHAVGLSVRTGIKSVFKDLPVIYKKYMNYQEQYPIPNKKKPWEYVSLSRNFSEDKTWDYLTGHVVSDCSITHDVYIGFEIPAGRYAVFQIRPRSKFLLGLEMGRVKKYIYGKWISKSRYDFCGYEFEYNNENMHQEKPYNIDLYVGIKNKDDVD